MERNNPQDPWDWNIHLHLQTIKTSTIYVGKYTIFCGSYVGKVHHVHHVHGKVASMAWDVSPEDLGDEVWMMKGWLINGVKPGSLNRWDRWKI